MLYNDRFWSKVEITNDCWLWRGNILRSGYGQFALSHSRMALAHRVSYQYAVGPIPRGLWVLHSCDVRSCVRPTHLFLGTNSDNQIDARNKGRGGRQKLKKQDIPHIRALMGRGMKQKDIALKYGVGYRAISQIKNGHRWQGIV